MSADSDDQLKDLIDYGSDVRRRTDVSGRIDIQTTVNPKLLAAGDIFALNKDSEDFKPLFNSTMLNYCRFEKTVAAPITATKSLRVPS